MGKVLEKAFRFLGLNGRKGKWLVEPDFYRNFWINVTWFLAIVLSSLLDQIMLILVWFERSLHPAQVN